MNDHPQPGRTGTAASRPEAPVQDDDHGHADMVIKAGAIHPTAQTRQTDARDYRAMAVRDGHIVALTVERDGADHLIGSGTAVVDDPSLTALPTCDDTHTHLIFAGRAVNDVQVADAKNLGEFLGLIRRRAAETQYWGRERTAEIFPLREWLDEGAVLSAGSDYPNGKYQPMASVWGMATRQTPFGVLGPGHAISRYEAVRLHTADAARFAGDGEVRGTLAPGKLADFAVYPADPLSCPMDELRGLLPVLTVVGGHACHDPGGLATRGGTPFRANTSS